MTKLAQKLIEAKPLHLMKHGLCSNGSWIYGK